MPCIDAVAATVVELVPATEATDGFPLVHVPVYTEQLSCVVFPMHKVRVPVIVGGTLTVTILVTRQPVVKE